MRRILKYQLKEIRTPILWTHAAYFIHVGEQNGVVCLWAIIDFDRPRNATTIFRLVMTGEEYSEHLKYIKTVQMQSGIVVHVFQELPPPPQKQIP